MTQAIQGLGGGNMLFVNTAAHVSAEHLMGVLNSVCQQNYFRLMQTSPTSIRMSKTELSDVFLSRLLFFVCVF